MSTMRIYNSMYDGMSHTPTTRSDANTNEIMERQKKLRQLRQTMALRQRQKAIYARTIAYYRRQIRIKTKERDKLAKKLVRYNEPFRKILQQQREKVKLDMEEQRIHLEYLKKMSAATKSAVKVYQKERRAYKRKLKASKILHLTKNMALKKWKRRIRTTKEKYENVNETIEELKKKLKLAKDRRNSLSLKDLKKKIKLNKERLEALEKKQTEQGPLIYQVLTDSKMTGFQRKTTTIASNQTLSNSQLDSSDVPSKTKSQTKRIRRLRGKLSGSFSTDTSMSKTSALKVATRQSEPIVRHRDTVLEPFPIGDKLQDKPKRLAHRFTRRLAAERTKKSKRSSSPPGDYKTPTTISAESDDTGVELKPKKKRVTLIIEPLPDSTRSSLIFHEATSSQDEISDKEAQWLKRIYDDKYFDRLAGKHGTRIRRELYEARQQKKLELERKLLEETEEKRKKALEFAIRKELRASSIDSTKLNQELKMAMKSTYKMTDVIPHNIQIIDEDILQLAGRHKRQTLQDVLKETEKERENNRILDHLKAMKTVGPIQSTSRAIRRSKLLRRRSSRKSQIKAEEKDAEEQITEEQVPKEKVSKKKLRKKNGAPKKVKAPSFTMSEDIVFDDFVYDDLFNEDFVERKSRRGRLSSSKKIEGLAYNNNSMYQKFMEKKKSKPPEQERGSNESWGSIGKRTKESVEFRKDVPEMPKQQPKETQPASVEVPKKRKSKTKAKRKSRVSLKIINTTSPQESIGVIAPHQKDGSVKAKSRESLEKKANKDKSEGLIKRAHQHLSAVPPKIQVEIDLRKEELPSSVDEHSTEEHKTKTEYDDNYFQRLFKAHSVIIRRKLHQERMRKLELQKKLMAQEQSERASLEKPRKSLASERASSFDSVVIMQKAFASNYRMPDVIPQDIPVVDENILELAGKTRRITMKDVLSGQRYSEEYDYPVRKSSVEHQRKSKLFKKKRSKKSKTKQRTEPESEVSEQIIKVIDLQANSISQPDDKFSTDDATYDDTKESEASGLISKKIEGLAYDHNSMYNKYMDEKKRRSLEEKRASLVIVGTPRQSTKPRRSIKRKTLEIFPYKRRSRRSIKRRPKKFLVIKTDPIHLKEISQRQAEIGKPAQVALQDLYQTQSVTPLKSEVRKTHSEPQLEKSNKIEEEKSKSLPDICPRTPEVHVVCSACGMTNLTPGGPCCPLIPETK